MTSGRKRCACARRRESATCLRRSWLRRRGRLQHGFLDHCDKRGLRTSANLCLHRGVVLIKQERSVGTLQAPTQRSSAMMLSRSQRPRAPERARCRARYRPAAPQPQSSPRRCRRHTQLCRWCALRHEGHVATLEVCIRRLRGHWSSPSPRVHSPVSRGSLQWFWAVLQGIVRMYGFEGEAGREGEGLTRIPESSYRRPRICCYLSSFGYGFVGGCHLSVTLTPIQKTLQ